MSVWALGEYARVAGALQPAADRLIERAGVEGKRVLDVGAGTGNAAAAALLAGAAEVVASDPEPKLITAGQRRLADVKWVEAGAEALPFEDAAFDVVVSCFGAIFAPDHERAATELARVGGVVALTAWIAEGPMAEVAKLLGRGAPPPAPGVGSPVSWGDEAYLRERFERHGLTLELSRESLAFTGRSLDAWMEHEERYATQWNAAQERLGDDWPALRDEVRAVLAAGNQAVDAFRVTSPYLVAVGQHVGE
jgi:SAM-dependent methyltransferase